MAERIDLPPQMQGTAEEQLQMLRNYLYRVATVLNVNQDMVGNEAVSLTDEERILMNNISKVIGSGDDTYYPGGHNYQEAETLKSLIIKTAKFVKTVQDTYNLILYGEETAEGDFGTWNRKKGLRVDVTPDGIKQTYSYAEIIKGLKDYEINAKSYIKTGQLRTEQGLPVYGVAIGKDVVTFSEDGTETYVDGNKVAELTADELSFYQNEQKVASYTGSQMTYYLNGKARLIIDGNGMTIQDANENKLAELNGTALSFYQNNEKLAEMSTDNTNQLIQFYENIELPSEVNNEKHIKLQSGSSIVLIDPTQINMNTPGLIVLKGSGNSAIDFRDATNGVVLKLDKDGLETQSMQADAAQFETLAVKNLTADNLNIPNIIYSATQPTGVHDAIWIEPGVIPGTTTPFGDSITTSPAASHSCPERSGTTFTYRSNMKSTDLTDVQTIRFRGEMNRQGHEKNTFTLTAEINCSDGSTISLGQLATGTNFGSYSWDETINYAGTAKRATGITYTLSVSDDFAHYSSFMPGNIAIAGEHQGTLDPDDCTVHYIP